MAKRRARKLPDGAELAPIVTAAFLNRCSRDDIERWLDEGKLRSHLIHKRVFIDLAELDALMHGQQPVCGCAGRVRRE